MKVHLCKHFERECHSGFRDDVSLILIDKADGSNPTKKTLDVNPKIHSTLWPEC